MEKEKSSVPSVMVPVFCQLNVTNARARASFQLPLVLERLNVTYATAEVLSRSSAKNVSVAASSSAKLAKDQAAPKAIHPP